MFRFSLLQKVRDRITGFSGTVIARTEHLNGCLQYGVKPRVDKDGKVRPAEWFDEQQLELIEDAPGRTVPESEPARRPGGPHETPAI